MVTHARFVMQWHRLASALAIAALMAPLSGAQAAPLGQGGAVVAVREDATLGQFLTDSKGMTLYLFTKDEPNKSNCYEGCAKAWPPFMPEGEPALPEGVPGVLTVIDRADGTKQLAYNGMPLYYWQNDKQPGDTTGQGVGGVWFVVAPTPAPTVLVAYHAELGAYLTDSKGMTLYKFTRDEPNKSNCYDQCARAWPPFMVEGEITLPRGMGGALTVIDRTDGTKQLAYNGTPLYYWQNDKQPGDTTGQGVGGNWFVVAPLPATTVLVREDATLGKFLTDSKGMTLYRFTRDEPNKSNCYDQCARAWPPFMVEGEITLPRGMGGTLTVIDRADGTKQLAYNGMPLYYWQNDKQPGDTTGQGVGGNWFVVAP